MMIDKVLEIMLKVNLNKFRFPFKYIMNIQFERLFIGNSIGISVRKPMEFFTV